VHDEKKMPSIPKRLSDGRLPIGRAEQAGAISNFALLVGEAASLLSAKRAGKSSPKYSADFESLKATVSCRSIEQSEAISRRAKFEWMRPRAVDTLRSIDRIKSSP
jgi:hypothetical protein